MKNMTELFVTPPEFSENRFIYRPIFRNKNIKLFRKGKKRCSLQDDFRFDRKSTLAVNKCFEGPKFVSYNKFLDTCGYMPEGAFLLFKKSLTDLFSVIGKFPPPIINKVAPK